MRSASTVFSLGFLLIVLSRVFGVAQAPQSGLAEHGLAQHGVVQRGSVKRIAVHGKALEGNLEGDSPDREVAIYLPPGYGTLTSKHYPVLYLLHGFTDNVDNWWGFKPHFVNVPVVLDQTIADGVAPMIVVMPNAFTRYQGSMYSNSVTTGDWQEYIAHELVSYVDSHYRTIADRSARGIAGHSMGGYGAMRMGMMYPDVYSSFYLLSPCCMETVGIRPNPRAEAIHDFAEIGAADFFTKAVFASAAAWSPNPNKPPFFLDLPYKNGEMQPLIIAKWEANAPLAMIDQFVPNLRQYKGIGMDAGEQDHIIAESVETLHTVLTDYRIPHVYQIYDGDHVNHVAERLEKTVIPFFARNLK